MKGKHVQGYSTCVGEDSYSLCFNEATSEDELGDRFSSQNDGHDDVIEIFVPLSNLS